MARGLGLATATTSAAVLPHLEQRVRSAISLRVTVCQRFRLDLTARAAVTDDAHQELAEAIGQFPDVREHSHAPMVLTDGWGVHAVLGERR